MTDKGAVRAAICVAQMHHYQGRFDDTPSPSCVSASTQVAYRTKYRELNPPPGMTLALMIPLVEAASKLLDAQESGASRGEVLKAELAFRDALDDTPFGAYPNLRYSEFMAEILSYARNGRTQ